MVMPNFDIWYPLGISATIYSALTLRLWLKKVSRRLRSYLGMRVGEEEKDSDFGKILELRAHIRNTVRAIVQGEEAESFASSRSPNPLMESDSVTELASEDDQAESRKARRTVITCVGSSKT
jgi:DNA topoisomerase VI subunit B